MMILFLGLLMASVIAYVIQHIRFTSNMFHHLEGFQGSSTDATDATNATNARGEDPEDLQNPYRVVNLFDRKNDLLLSDRTETRRSQIGLSASQCLAEDIYNNLMKVGSYRQLTNNYKRELPDNCSMWNKELSPFYVRS